MLQLVPVLREQLRRVARPLTPVGDVPLHVHARYSLAELLAAFGVPNPVASRGSGVKQIEHARAHVFWFNLRKTQKHYSPTTMYADRAISPRLFQWESQNATSVASPIGESYVQHRGLGWTVHLFFRDSKEADGQLGAPGISLCRDGILREPFRGAADADYLETRPRASSRRLSRCRRCRWLKAPGGRMWGRGHSGSRAGLSRSGIVIVRGGRL